MKRLTSFDALDDGLVVLANGTRWKMAVGRHLDVVFWRYGVPVESEDYPPAGYLRNLNSANPIPATRVKDAERGDEGAAEEL
jgi:hypothetical protein